MERFKRNKTLSHFFPLEEDQTLEGRKIVDGVKAVNDVNKPTPESAPPVGAEQPSAKVNDLVDKVSDPNNALTEISLPDGTTIKGAYVGNTQQINPTTSNPQPPSQLNPVQVPNAPNGIDYQALAGSPQVIMALGEIAKALGTVGNYQTTGARLGQSAIEGEQNKLYQQYLGELASGKTPADVASNPRYALLPPELKSRAAQEALAYSQMSQREKQLGIEQQKADAYSKLAEAQVSGTLTKEDKMRLAEIENATKAKIGEMANRYLRLNPVQYLDTTTGDVFTVPGGDLTKMYGNGNLKYNATFAKLIQDNVTALFMNKALDNYLKQTGEKIKDADRIKAMQQLFIADPTTGSVAWQKVFNFLKPEDKVKFAQELTRFTANMMGGVPPAYSFATSPVLPKPNEQQQPQPGEKPKIRIK